MHVTEDQCMHAIVKAGLGSDFINFVLLLDFYIESQLSNGGPTISVKGMTRKFLILIVNRPYAYDVTW